jgi:uncharacterized protein (TIGR03083 family)
VKLTIWGGVVDRDQSWRVIDDHRARVADLLDGLDDEQWEHPSLCKGWRVRDVGAHLSLAPTTGLGEVLGAVVAARGNFDRMIRDTAIARARRPRHQIVADLRGVVGSRRLAPSTVWRDPLLDVLVHAQDIARPLGLRFESPVEAQVETADWAWRRRFPFFPARRLKGFRLVADDADWARGSGTEVRGPVGALLLLSTGRAAGLDDLEVTQEQRAELAGRFR